MPSAVIGALRVSLGIDSAEFSSGANKVEKRSRKMGEAIQRNLGAGMDRAVSSLKAFATAYLSLEGAKKFLEYADAAKNMDAQLKLATASFGSMAKAQEDVNRIATTTRSGVVEITALYGNFIRASAGLGKTQDEAARATETFSKALTIGGAGAAEAASATLQFGQALASGVLRGDEFNSIAEASPRILKLIADSLGVTSGALRAMAADGKLSAEALYRALTDRKFTAGIDAEFEELPVTFQQAMTLVNNAAITTIGAFDNGGQFSTAIANFITNGTGGFADLSESATQFGIDTRATFDAFGTLFDPLLANGESVFEALGFKIATIQQQIYNLLSGIDQLRNIPIDLNNRAVDFDQKYLSGVPGYKVGQRVERSNLAGQFAKNFRAAQASRRADVERRAASAAVDNGRGTRNAPVAEGGDDKKAAAAAKKAARDRERAAEKARRDEQVFQQDLARAQDDQLRAQLDLTVDQTERVRIQQALLDNDRDARLKAIENDENLNAEQKKQLSLLVSETSTLEARLLHRQDQEKLAELSLEKAQAQAGNEIDILDAQASLARTAKERGRIERLILDKQFDLLRLVQQNALDEATRKGDTQGAAIAQARLGALDTLQALGRQNVERRNQGPLAAYLDSIPKTAEEVNEALEGIQANGLSDLIDGLARTKGSFKDLADVVSSVADDIISSLIRIGLQKGIAALFGSMLGSGSATYANPFANDGTLSLPGVDIAGLAGARAKGGSVVGGRNYLVGEMGPEIFTAPSSGNIIANDDIGMGGGMRFEQHVHVAGAVDLATRSEVYRLAGATKDAAVAAIRDADRRRG